MKNNKPCWYSIELKPVKQTYFRKSQDFLIFFWRYRPTRISVNKTKPYCQDSKTGGKPSSKVGENKNINGIILIRSNRKMARRVSIIGALVPPTLSWVAKKDFFITTKDGGLGFVRVRRGRQEGGGADFQSPFLNPGYAAGPPFQYPGYEPGLICYAVWVNMIYLLRSLRIRVLNITSVIWNTVC